MTNPPRKNLTCVCDKEKEAFKDIASLLGSLTHIVIAGVDPKKRAEIVELFYNVEKSIEDLNDE